MMDWVDGSWANPAESGTAATVLIASDWAPIRAFDRIVAEDPEAAYGDLLPVLRAADLRIANLECPLSSGGQPACKSGSVFKGLPAHIRGLTAVPFQAVTLGNNHVFDYGLEGFRETRELLRVHGILTAGAGMNADEAWKPLILDHRGVAVAILNFSEGEDLTAARHGPGVAGWEVERMVRLVREVRAQVDAVIVIAHCGVEYIPVPPPYVTAAFQRIAEAGADLVVGHHPHVPQGVQIHRGVPICYSLGNFLFHQETDRAYRKVGYLVRAHAGREGVTRVELVPYALGPGLRLLEGDARAGFLHKLEEASRPLQSAAGVAQAWAGFLRHYGARGFRQEVEGILETLARDPGKGAAMFRNRIVTPQHTHPWVDVLTRIMDGSLDDAPQWAHDLAAEWLTATRCPWDRP